MKINILFVGGAKRVSLIEKFYEAAEREGDDLNIFISDMSPYIPAGKLGQVILLPRIDSNDFNDCLLDAIENHGIDIIIPNLDIATVKLAEVAEEVKDLGAWPLVSSVELCRDMFDKISADTWFESHNIPTPPREHPPFILKPRFGCGSKGIKVFDTVDEAKQWLTKSPDYLLQTFLQGQEYTIDAYVDRSGHLLDCLSRLRVRVSDGEVEVSKTSRQDDILDISRTVLENLGWLGPITLQFIKNEQGSFILEVNPRLGGGVTHSIHCGLDMPRWIIREYKGLEIEPIDQWLNNSLMVRCRRDFFYDHTG